MRTLLQIVTSLLLLVLLALNPLAYLPQFQPWLPSAEHHPMAHAVLGFRWLPLTVIAIVVAEGALIVLRKLGVFWDRLRTRR